MQFQSNPKNSDGEMSSERINKVLDRARYAYSTFHRNVIRWLLSQYGIDDKDIGEVIKKSDERRKLKPIVTEWERFMTEAYRKEAAELEHQERISNPQSLLEWGWVYFIRKEGSDEVKIGYSANPDERLRGLQTGHANKLSLMGSIPGTYRDEHALHAKFAQYRISGEWFILNQEIRNYIADVTSKKQRQRQ